MLEIVATIMGVVMSFGYYPQIYKMLKNKSSENISLVMYIIFGIGTIIWTLYGFYINDFVIISSFIVGVIGSWTVIFLYFLYKK